MCGIVGLAGKLEHPDQGIMKKLLLMDYFRGGDSTGLASIDINTGTVNLTKIASHPIDLFDSQKFVKTLSYFENDLYIGHNRAATMGEINGYNAHPFTFDHVTGCHNGTLSRVCWQELEDNLKEDFTVDSMALIAHIDKFGIEKTVPILQGAYAIVWYDKRDKTINFIRNKERPLWYAFSATGDKLFYASEWPMIQAACKLSKTDYTFHVNEGGYAFHEFIVDTHYSWKVSDIVNAHKVVEPKKTPMKGKEVIYSVVTGPFAGANHTNTYYKPPATIDKNNKIKPKAGKAGPVFGDTKIFISKEGNPYAGKIERKRFQEIASNGCSYCSSTIKFEDIGTSIYIADDIILCNACSPEPNVNRLIVPSDYNA